MTANCEATPLGFTRVETRDVRSVLGQRTAKLFPQPIVRRFSMVGFIAALTLVSLGCASNDTTSSGTSESSTAIDTTEETSVNEDQLPDTSFSGHVVESITRPSGEPQDMHYPQPATVLPDHYQEEEFFLGGTATSFEAVETPRNGAWVVTPSDEAPYQTRAIVRRPKNPSDFSGTVLVEWFNVSAIEAAPDWGFLHEAITRDGHAYIGVSVQAQGVVGGNPLLGVEVDEDATQEQGVAAAADGLVTINPSRYGQLVHPGDAYAFDIYAQSLKAARFENEALLGGFSPKNVIAMGESQSAMFLTTYINAVHVLDPVANGFLIHSRGAMVPEIDGNYTRSQVAAAEDSTTNGVLVRTDLDVPVFIVAAETDLTVLGYANARQDDTDQLRTWEIAGTAHADAETLRAVIGGPRDPMIGDLLGCGSINIGPHKEVLRAALHHLIGWVDGGDPPPTAPRIELEASTNSEGSSPPKISRDEHGNALGGIRTPMLDVPTATLTGDPPSDAGLEQLTESTGVCTLFGQTIPFDTNKIGQLYGSFEAYITKFQASAEQVIDAGFMLEEDAQALIDDMEANRHLFDSEINS